MLRASVPQAIADVWYPHDAATVTNPRCFANKARSDDDDDDDDDDGDVDDGDDEI